MISFNEKVLDVLRSSRFLAFVICLTASAAFGLANSGINIIVILLAIFAWVAYSNARKGRLDTDSLRRMSGTYFAKYVIQYVIIALLVILDLIFMILGKAIFSSIRDIINVYGFFIANKYNAIIVMLTVFIVALVVTNIIGNRKVHRFLRSLYRSCEQNVCMLENANEAAIWLLIIGILNVFTVHLSINANSIISAGSLIATYVLAYLMVKDLSREQMYEHDDQVGDNDLHF